MRDLFRIETDRLLLTWGVDDVGPVAPPGTAAPVPVAVHPRRAGLRYGPAHRSPPVRLHEQTDYSLFLRSATDAPVSIEHRDPVLLRGIRSAEEGRIVFGRINFGSQVGRSVFSLRVGGEPELELEVEVFPSKLDYAADYDRLVADTREVLSGLVIEYLRSTFRLGGPGRVPEATELEWLLLLGSAVDELERAVGEIARRPVRGLAHGPQEVRAERAGRPDPALRRAVARGAGRGAHLRLRDGTPVREWLPERRARPTLDTPEHRWLAAQVGRIGRRLARLRREEAERGGGERHARILAEMDRLEERLGRLSRAEPLLAATAEPPPGFASLQLLSAPGYREAYRACLALSQGVHLEGGPVHLSLKELHLLYEYWCFLSLVRLLCDVLAVRLPAHQLLAADAHGLRVLLRHGQEHAVRLEGPAGLRVTLAYNPRFGGEPLLVPQRPDFLLAVHRPGEPPRHAVLDAKYRIDASAEYVRRYGAPGPPEEALNSLHRYRDAIVGPDRLIAQAVALFPHREPEEGSFRGSRLWGSLAGLGVGAIPLLPGETGYLEEWLRGALGLPG